MAKEVLIENKIINRKFPVGVIGAELLPVIEICIKSGFYDYQNKCQDGLTEEIVPAQIYYNLPLNLQHMSKEVCDELGLEVYYRTDFIVSTYGDVYVIKINSLLGMTLNS